jgi:hypothetical protein
MRKYIYIYRKFYLAKNKSEDNKVRKLGQNKNIYVMILLLQRKTP